MFIGRENEQKAIHSLFSNDSFESILIYGRRRIGKSELIKKCINDTFVESIYYECKQTTQMNNVESLSKLISEKFNLPKLAFNSIEEVLEYLFQYSTTTKLILVLDEYSYLKNIVKGMDSILQSLIDQYKENSNLKLILCGSYIDIMQSLIQANNPLFGRISKTIDLKQMDYYDSAKFYPTFSNEDKICLYSVFGGIPYYNRLIDSQKSVKQNIIDLIASSDSRLELEISMYLKSEISKLGNANEVFEALAKGNTKYNDIFSKSHISSGPTLIDVLDKLIKMEVVSKEAPINDELNKKKSGYYICDNLSLFYYKYIFQHLSQLNVMDSNAFYEHYIRDDFEKQYVPHMFEKICKQYLIRQNRSGKIEEVFHKIGKYYYDDPINKTNGEFDIVTEDINGYIFYECKYRNEKLSQKTIQEEIQQVKNTGLQCYKYGFFTKNGYEKVNDDSLILYDLDDLFNV